MCHRLMSQMGWGGRILLLALDFDVPAFMHFVVVSRVPSRMVGRKNLMYGAINDRKADTCDQDHGHSALHAKLVSKFSLL